MLKNCENCQEEVVELEGEDMGKLLEMLESAEAEEDYEDSREIFVTGEINETTIQRYILPILAINKEDDEADIPIEEREPIKLYFSCVGGDVTHGLALVDIIEASKTPIWGINLTYAMSMGAIILLSCHRRFSYKRATILIHDGFCTIENTGGKARDVFEYVNALEQQVKEIIINRSKISKRILDKKFHKEWYIGTSEALKLNLIDGILTELM